MSYDVQTIARDALRLIGVVRDLPFGSTEAADLLRDLNQMLTSWQDEDVLTPAYTWEHFPLVANQTSYTIGSGGNFNTVRPAEIIDGFVRDADNNDYPLEVNLTKEEYDGIIDKEVTGIAAIPFLLCYDAQFPLGVIYPYPPADSATSYTLYIQSLKPFTELTAVTDTLSVVPECIEAIKYNFAIRQAANYGQAPMRTVKEMATELYNKLQVSHYKPPIATIQIGNRSTFNIKTG